MASTLLIVALNAGVYAQTQGSVFVYTSVGGTITANGTAVTGGSTQSYNVGTTVNFNAVTGTGFKFIGWETVTASGANTTTVNPLAAQHYLGHLRDTSNLHLKHKHHSNSNNNRCNQRERLWSVGGTTSPSGAITAPSTS